jgi:undecaprenyl-diphosphatase
MNLFQSVILGLVQGIAEFLPISSTGHLVLVPAFFNWAEPPLVFDTTLHLGTAFALLFYFRKDIWEILKTTLTSKLNFNNLGLKILVGSIPAGILGVLIGDYIENVFRDPKYVLVFVTLGTLLMYCAEYFGKRIHSFEKINFKFSALIGAFQALALFPGVSRSGATISGGMLFGLDRESASRFSFLLSLPIVLAAALFKGLGSYTQLISMNLWVVFAGFIVSFVSGLIAVDFLLKFLRKGNLYPFIIYRVILALVIGLVLLPR